MTERDQELQRVYIEGRNAFHDGLTKDNCPHKDQILLGANWECGYEDAFAEYAESFGGEQL